ncbi:MAG: DUF1572 family protein [Candidatus Zixiibacteriota bacterium]
MTSIGTLYLNDVRTLFLRYRDLAERAMRQISDDAFFHIVEADGNSIAIIVKHIAGNIRSRWTDMLTSDGEKPDRNRDAEFEIDADTTREQLMEIWDRSWGILFATLDSLKADHLTQTIRIRNEPHTVLEAINRQLTHYANHVGQIITLARQAQGADWESLSIPRGQSDAFNATMQTRHGM